MRSRLWDLARNRRVLQCYQTRDVVRGQGHDQEKMLGSVKTVRTDPGRTRGARYNQGRWVFLSFYLLFQCISHNTVLIFGV
ncbi:hypothetical protein HanXRQr2_Chr07g0283561 [Helianthus annuus]|nr:hypothetical protein HanXRQr2_Chr07g0283561 [Helianthus annuus]KAJ0903818.1 hypothetical protein HanPSC8_Chr07g0274391 [Helianthus annuus]